MIFKKIIKYYVVLTILLSSAQITLAADNEFITLNIGSSTCSEFVDFLYDFSRDHRLNLLWFGWCNNPDASTWFERSEEGSHYKVKMYLLDEGNGDLFITGAFDEKHPAVSIDLGSEIEPWLNTVEEFKKQITARGWIK